MILRHDQAGTGPAVVLLHARPADRTQWGQILRLLAAAGYRAIAPDLPGYGESPAATGGPRAPWADVRDTLDALGVGRAVLAGNSLGAQTALEFAATWPQRVRGLVLMGYRRHGQPPSPQLTKALDEESQALARDDLDAAVDSGLRAWLSPAAGPAERALFARALRRNRTRRSEAAPVEAAPDPLAGPAWAAALTMPARILHGADDLPDFAEGAQKLQRALRAPEITTVPDAGHLLPLDQPAAVAIAILEILAEASTA